MLTSFFFIPGVHPKLGQKLQVIGADEYIIDLEDSVKNEDLNRALLNISNIGFVEKYWIRPPVFTNTGINEILLKNLIEMGFRRFLIPKIRNQKDLLEVEKILSDLGVEKFEVILLVENAECFYYLNHLLSSARVRITGLGFGSQDYCAETGMDHTAENLYHPRWIISNTSKALGLTSIDIACMDIYGGEGFVKEISEAKALGYDAKFVLHPSQLKVLEKYPYYSNEEILKASEIMSLYESSGRPSVFLYGNRLIEPPHIRQYNKIIKWASKYDTK